MACVFFVCRLAGVVSCPNTPLSEASKLLLRLNLPGSMAGDAFMLIANRFELEGAGTLEAAVSLVSHTDMTQSGGVAASKILACEIFRDRG